MAIFRGIKDKVFRTRFIRSASIILTLVLGMLLIGSAPLLAIDIKDYFSYDSSFAFSKTQINENESFSATATGTARCTKDLWLPATEGTITGRVVAQHKSSSAKVILNSSYTLNIPDVPDRAGQSYSVSPTTVALKFPAGSTFGEYRVIGEVVQARVKSIGFWVTIVPDLMQIEPKELGTIIYGTIPSGGGGVTGGGGGSGNSAIPQIVTVTADVSTINVSGTFSKAFVAEFSGGKHKITVGDGTKARNDDGSPVWKLTMSEAPTQRTAPANAKVIGTTYICGPDGASFDPPIKLTLSFDRYILADMPPGFELKSLVVAVWDTATSAWSKLPSTVNTENFTITASVSHFSEFTILAPTRPASFTISGLSIAPAEAAANEAVSIGVTVANAGDLAGNYTVTLKLNDATAETKDVSVPGGERKQVTFTVSKGSAGRYAVSVNDLNGAFTVKGGAGAAPAPSPTSVPSPTPVQTQAPPQVTTTPTPAPQVPRAPQPFNWLLVLGVLVGLIIIGIAAQLVVIIKKH